LQGKALGCPLYQLLGGKCRDEFSLCAPIGLKDDRAEFVDTARELYERGFRAFLLKIGGDAKVDYANVKAVRETLGPDVVLRVDANASMSFDDALMLLKKLEPFDIDTAEQPLAIWDLDGMAELARRVDIPIMADEAVCDEHDLINVIKKRAASVLQTKQAKNGGLWTVRKLWTIAAAAGLRIYPGNHASASIATAAVAHLAAAWPGPLVDGPFAMGVTGELADDVVTEPLQVIGNTLKVPTGPGLGVILDEDKISRMRVDL
jgi:L-alanine-DL-glutamate epimerase-like enolase superfamily enzyme